MEYYIWLLVLGLLGMAFALFTYLLVLRPDEGNRRMREISREIRDGAMVFLKLGDQIILIFMAGIFVIIPCFISIYRGFAIGSANLQLAKEELNTPPLALQNLPGGRMF